MLIVDAFRLPDAVDPRVAALATMTTRSTPAAASAFLIPGLLRGSGSQRALGIPAANEPKGRFQTSQPRRGRDNRGTTPLPPQSSAELDRRDVPAPEVGDERGLS